MVVAIVFALTTATSAIAARGTLELTAIDEATSEPTAIRLGLRNAKGRPVFPPKLPRVGDAFVFDGSVVLELHPGLYTFDAHKGFEYRPRTGHFVIESGATDNQQVEMKRYVDMPAEGWWSGDLHVERPLREIPLLMLASDLYFANVVSWNNRQSNWQRKPIPRDLIQHVGRQRRYEVMAGRDRRAGSEVVLGQMQRPVELADDDHEYPTPFQVLKEAATAKSSPHVHLSRLDVRDLPVWLASGKLNSVGLLHSGLLTDGSRDDSICKDRDPVLFPDPHGVGRWSQQIYFRMLNAGLRIPPAAGSGAGLNANPIGSNRVYVHCGEPFSAEAWWQGLRDGRVVVTNGPLLRPRVNGQLPGHVFQSNGDRLELEIEAQLGTTEKIDYFEVIKDGRSEQQVRLEDWAAQGGRLPAVIFEQSGWLMLRVVTRNQQTYRCACSGPFYVEFNDQPLVRQSACQFFVDWVYDRAREIRLEDPQQQAKVMRFHRAARDYWQQRLAETQPE